MLMTAVRKKSLMVNKQEKHNMFNYINSWKSRKSEKWNIEVRLGRITLLQLNYDAKKAKFRFMLLNFGLEIGGK